MDNICHTLAGAALGEAGLKRQSRLGVATLLIASNLPDIDVAVFATDTLAMSVRRGWTHGVVAMALLPALLAGVMCVWGRGRGARTDLVTPGEDEHRRLSRHGREPQPLRIAGLFVLAYIGTWLHVFMDWLNSYGVRLLKPLSDRWFYGDALYIIDPLLYACFGAAIVLARRAAARAVTAPWRPAQMALAVAGVYVTLMVASNWWARAEVRSGLERAGRGNVRFMVTPVFASPFQREVVVDLGERYEKGFLWFDPLPHFRPAGYGVETNASDPAVLEARRHPRIQAFLMWSRFPFFVVQREHRRTRVFVNDYRYSGPSGRDGWATQMVEIP
jgi:inner membrane protein